MGILQKLLGNGDQEELQSQMSELKQFKSALDACQGNVMMADTNLQITYINQSLKKMLRHNEAVLRQHLPGFNVESLVGVCVDVFHAHPAKQRQMIDKLTEAFNTRIKVGPLTFNLIATPIFDENSKRTGTVVEWQDMTQQLQDELAAKETNMTNQRMRSALDVCQTNIMMADADCTINYINASLHKMLKQNEAEIKAQIASFDVNKLLGTNIDIFHKSPSHQRNLLAGLTTSHHAKIQVGGLTFTLIATPVFDAQHQRLGTVVEWKDMTEELKRQAAELLVMNDNTRIRDALSNIETCVMIADGKNNIIYMNKAVISMLSVAESDLRKSLPNFSVNNLMNQNIDVFHKNPAHQRGLLEKLTTTYSSTIQVSNRTFSLIANPVFNDKNERIGTVVEWKDRTAEVEVEKDIGRVVTAAVGGKFDERISEVGKQGFMLTLASQLNQMTSSADVALKEICTVLKSIAEGDLTMRVTSEFEGAFDELKESCNSTAGNLARMLGEIRIAADTINTASSEISDGNTDLSSRTEQQASNLEETASSMEELTGTVRQNSDNARQANALAANAAEVAVGGGALIEQVVSTMASINESAQKIADIIGVIDGIAFQTNILALNAAVEAARAGEQGRGFAVVASEVRTLAQRSANAAKDIKGLISDSVNKIRNGNELVDKSGSTMKDVVHAIKKVNDIMGEIAAASQEQSNGIDEISKAINQMDEMTQQNAALVEEAAAAAESLQAQAEQLTDQVAMFKLDEQVARPVASKAPRLAAGKIGNKPSSTAARGRPTAQKPKQIRSLPKDSGSEDEWESF
jgi:methyl-accepting chemotaxis protein